MIKFFRKIRYDLMEKNKKGKYFKYAIGEILLVVIGILIALSINNWNESKKDNRRKAEYINGLIEDLKKDSLLLINHNKAMQNDLDKIINISKRLSRDEATIDSVKYIYNNEYTGRFDPTNTFNRNTYNIIISTGDLKLFSPEFKNNLLTFYQSQDRSKQVVEENIDLNLDRLKQLDLPPSAKRGITGNAEFGIRGKLLEQMLKRHTDDNFLVQFSKSLSNKAVMEENLIFTRNRQLNFTYEFLEYLYLNE